MEHSRDGLPRSFSATISRGVEAVRAPHLMSVVASGAGAALGMLMLLRYGYV